MDEEIDVSVTVEQLKAAGTNLSKQVPALLKLGEWYLTKAKTTSNGTDFTKANALYNAALVRSRSVNHEIGEDQILRGIVETYREFLYAFAKANDKISLDEIQNEIDSHKEWIARERRIFKERVDEIDFFFNPDDKTEREYEIHAEKMYELFRDIQDMYIRLVSMLAKECESRLGKPPCDYAIIALGSVARMEATPFSDLEFAILYSDPTIGDKINYFQVLSHFLHLKVINLGETILPALGIEQLNDFQSSDPIGNWFYDSETPRGISFDGAMPWASKTALGRMATKNKPALELIRTPEEMAELQDEEIAVKEGYHLANILSRAALLYGEQALLDEYNERVSEKLNTNSSVTEANPTKTVGFIRGMRQMIHDLNTYSSSHSYLGYHCIEGALFDAKKQFYRLISLLLSGLGLIFDIRCPSPWQIISELQSREIISDTETANIKVCLSIANKIRLKTYFANNGQKELFSPVPQNANTTEKSAHAPIFRDFDEDILVRLLSTSNDMHGRCHEFCMKYTQQDEIDISIFRNPSVLLSKAILLGCLYIRLQNFPKALEWFISESTDSPDYVHGLAGQGVIFCKYGEYEKSVKCFENALEVHYQNKQTSNLDVLVCNLNIAGAQLVMGQYGKAITKLQEAISQHHEIYGKGSETFLLSELMRNLGMCYSASRDDRTAVKAFQEVEQMQNRLTVVPDGNVIYLQLNIAKSLSVLDQYAQSLEYVKRALHLSLKVFGKHDLSSVLARIYMDAGSVYDRCNLDDEALASFKRSLELFELVYGDNAHPDKLLCLCLLGEFFSRRYQTSKAVEHHKSALKQARTLSQGKPHLKVAQMLNNLGLALKRAEKSEESLPFFQEAKEIMDQIFGPNHVHFLTSCICHNMGKSYQGLGDLDQAKEYCTKAVDIERKINFRNTYGLDTRYDLVVYLNGLSHLCQARGEQDEALKHGEEAREIAQLAGFKDYLVFTVVIGLSKLYDDMKCDAKSNMYFLEAIEIAKSLPEADTYPPSVLRVIRKMKEIPASTLVLV